MLDWASGELYSELFDAVFLFEGGELKCVSEEMSLVELLSWCSGLTAHQVSELLEIRAEKVLILIDEAHLRSEVLKQLSVLEVSVMITTRLTTEAKYMHLYKGPQRFTEILGFSETGVKQYFQAFFQNEEHIWNIFEHAKKNQTFLISCSVPLLCWMVCSCLKKYFLDDLHVIKKLKTTTSIFELFVSSLLKVHDQNLAVFESLAQLAESANENQDVFFDERRAAESGLDCANCVLLKRQHFKGEAMYKFIHPSFQEFFTALHYLMFSEPQKWNLKGLMINVQESFDSSPNFTGASILQFVFGLCNGDFISQLVKSDISSIVSILLRRTSNDSTHNLEQLYYFRYLYEAHSKRLLVRSLHSPYINLSKLWLKSTDCWMLRYCLHFRRIRLNEINLIGCDLTAEKLKILQPVLLVCETLRLSVEHLSEVGGFLQTLGEAENFKLIAQEEDTNPESPGWSLDLSVQSEDILMSLSSLEKNPSSSGLLNISIIGPQLEVSSTDWTIFLQRLSFDCQTPDDHISLLLSSFKTTALKRLDLKISNLNESWASGIISLLQSCSGLKRLSICVTGLILEEAHELLTKSLTNPPCTLRIEGLKCLKAKDQCREQNWALFCNQKTVILIKPKILEEVESLGLRCQACAHIADSGQWIQVEPSVFRDERGIGFWISMPAGQFQCSRTRIRWVCASDVVLHYRAVDGCFLMEHLERLQREQIAPVFDVSVISGKLQEAHLPHYACLAESDPSLEHAVELLSVEDGGLSLESVELSRFHAKIIQPVFSPKTVLVKLGIPVRVHCDLQIFMTQRTPIILHVYFFPSDLNFKERIKSEEHTSHPIKCPRPETTLRMMKQHSLQIPGAAIQPLAIKLRGDILPNFFKVKLLEIKNILMTLSQVDDNTSVWMGTIWKEELEHSILNTESSSSAQSLAHFDKVQFFDKNWCRLIKSVKNVNAIADKLLQKKILHEQLYSKIILQTSAREESMREICTIVRAGSAEVKEMFVIILLQENPNLLQHLPFSES